jgi:GDP-4-dehydro-6-deoxy-D-mannose reductase
MGAAATLVTGAGGFAGGHLLDLLSGPPPPGGGPLVAWHRPGAPPGRPGRAHWMAVDVLDRDAVGRAIAEIRPDRVYHCAGAAHVGRAWDRTESTLAINVRGTHHVLEALAGAHVACRVLLPGSALVYAVSDGPLGEDSLLVPSGPYGLSKLAQELLAGHARGRVEVLVARAFNHMGPRQDPAFAASGFARRIADIEAGRWAPEISVGNLEARRDLTDVRDTVRAYQAILERGAPRRAYNVCTGSAVAIADLLNMLIARAKVPVTVKRDPARFRPNDVPLLLGDPRRIHDELGWTPGIPIGRTLDDLLAYWRAQPR